METLHSTMFPINLIRIVGAIQLNHLYIPLCFLLILTVILTSDQSILSLHSTMFPINRYCDYRGCCGGHCFTFHYVSY